MKELKRCTQTFQFAYQNIMHQRVSTIEKVKLILFYPLPAIALAGTRPLSLTQSSVISALALTSKGDNVYTPRETFLEEILQV